MKKRLSIILLTVGLLFGLTANGQDTKSQFNPIEHAVVSQTIAPMPVLRVWVMLVWQPIRM